MLVGKTPISSIISAINCFKKQTYSYKELIIINNSKTHFEAVSLNIKAERDVFMVDTPFLCSAGMARNYGISASNGRILAQFDADCWHAPNRLETQIATLAENQAHIAILDRTLSYSFLSGRASYNTNDKKAILNTMVFVRPAQIDYPNTEKQEELGLLTKMQAHQMKTISIPLPELVCKLYVGTGEKITKPKNNGLTQAHYKIVKKIVKSTIV